MSNRKHEKDLFSFRNQLYFFGCNTQQKENNMEFKI